MKDEFKTREQLLEEMAELRKWVAELEALEGRCELNLDALRREHSLASSILDGLGEPVVVITPDFRARLINRAAREMLDYKEEPLLCSRCFHQGKNCREEEQCPLVIVRSTGRPVTVVHEHDMPGGAKKFFEIVASPFLDEDGSFFGIIESLRDITERRKLEDERERLIGELRDALAHIKTLKGLIPICAWCKKIRDDRGYWKAVEEYIKERTGADFTHGICPDCLKKSYGESPEEA
jgi:PAS domain S-box-containing protein